MRYRIRCRSGGSFAGTGSASGRTAHATEQARLGVAAQRRRRQQEQRQLTPDRLVFLDETWASIAMARPRGRAPRGDRLISAGLYGHRKTTTFVAGLRQSGLVAPLVPDGPMHREYSGLMSSSCLRQPSNRATS